MQKKVLIINIQSSQANTGTGITMRSIFNHGYVTAKELYFIDYKKDVKNTINYSSEQITSFSRPINFIVKKLGFSSSLKSDISAQKRNSTKKIRIFITGFLKAFIDNSCVILKRKEKKLITKFKPEYVYTMGSTIFCLRYANKVSRKYRIPLVIHYMDNWRTTLYSHKGLHFYNKILNNEIKKAQKYGVKHICVSQEMSNDYSALYNYKYETLMNVPEDMFHITAEDKDTKKSKNIVYIGGLHLKRDASFISFVNCINNNEKYKNLCNIIIYTDVKSMQLIEKFKKLKNIKIFEYVPHDQIQNIYASADILLHIESFDKEIREYIKYSISTKISEYLCAQKPILLFAPSDIAVYKYIYENNCGYVAENTYQILLNLNKIFYGEKDTEQKAKNAYNVYIKNHTEKSIYDIFSKIFV